MRNYPPAILDRKIRFALVGCGRIASNHFGAIRQHSERCELACVCDIDPRRKVAGLWFRRARTWAGSSTQLSR